MTTPSAPTRDIGVPDLTWWSQGQGLGAEWWETSGDLIWPQSVITYGRMRHDLQIRATLSAYVLPILRATWVVDPEGCRDEVVQRTADDLGIGILGQDIKPGPARRRGVIWHRHLRQALQFLAFGYSVFERRYEILGDGYARLVSLGQRPPWTIANIDVGQNGVVRSITQTTQRDPIPANRLVWYVQEQEGANWAGISMLRSAYGAWLLKHETWRVHATSIRRFGMGVPGVEAPAGATQAQVQQARDLASNMRAGDQAGIGIPTGFRPFLMGLTGSVPDALAFIRYLDQSIAKSVLAGLIELGQTETGSRALGETFLDLFLLSLQAVADEIATVATSGWEGMPGIVTDIVDQNWGEGEPAPRVVCTDVGENYQVTADAIAKLCEYGALAPDTSLDEWIRKTWRLPARSGPITPPAPSTPPAGRPQPSQDSEAPQAPAQPPAPAAAGRRVAARKPNAREVQAGFLPDQHQRDWQTALDTLMLAYLPVVREQRTTLADQVTAAVDKGRPDRLSLAPPPLGEGPKLILAAMQGAARGAADAMTREADLQGVEIDPARVKIDAARLSRIATARAGLAASYLAQQASVKALQITASNGTDAGDAIEAYLGGLSETPLREQLGAALTAAQNTGRVAVMEAAPESAGQAVYVATEILDTNTCDNCRHVDGTEFPTLEDAEAAYPTGGYRDCQGLARCRGTVMAVWEPPEAGVPVPGDPLSEVAAKVYDSPSFRKSDQVSAKARAKVEDAARMMPEAMRASLRGRIDKLILYKGKDTGMSITGADPAAGLKIVGQWRPSTASMHVSTGRAAEDVMQTMLHESLHAFDEAEDLVSLSPEWAALATRIRQAGGNRIGAHYGVWEHGDQELFAEVGARWIAGAPYRIGSLEVTQMSADLRHDLNVYFETVLGVRPL